MNYFLSGGAKNGKSSFAQEIVCAQSGPRYYLATMIPHDDEDRLRIRRHLENRAGLGFQTVECGTDILSSLSRMEPDGAVLLDSVTALLSNEMFRADGTMDASAPAVAFRPFVILSAVSVNIIAHEHAAAHPAGEFQQLRLQTRRSDRASG